MSKSKWTKVENGRYQNDDGYVIHLDIASTRWVLSKDGVNLFNFDSKKSAIRWAETVLFD